LIADTLFVPYKPWRSNRFNANVGSIMVATHLNLRLREAATKSAITAFDDQVRSRNAGMFVRDPEAERLMLRHWPTAYKYSRELLRSPWPEFEDSMKSSPASADTSDARAAFNYAHYVADRRIEGIEKHIARDAMAALDYAKLVLERPWNSSDLHYEAATNAIMKHPTAQNAYQHEMGSIQSHKMAG
jgi:hypothetical protein